MLDEDELALLQAADRGESVIRPSDNSKAAAEAFDRLCEKLLVLGRRRLLSLFIVALRDVTLEELRRHGPGQSMVFGSRAVAWRCLASGVAELYPSPVLSRAHSCSTC
jgi:hypothetical protein